jgi:hypothetical protein
MLILLCEYFPVHLSVSPPISLETECPQCPQCALMKATKRTNGGTEATDQQRVIKRIGATGGCCEAWYYPALWILNVYAKRMVAMSTCLLHFVHISSC